ncbi:glycosyltransferase [Paenibacillus donghaensis]|uniref:Glycosyl transferase family 1 domain-containing protein n=1 Tax=Paenibacillus donghaensis TaxID=414771 RepID=A0A2Z2KMV3_9BACL|nr:glycosyltransferase [Paenibacillus donghaensis]ASA23899.1 hypothetical protein B9T62_25825 [Paenibacillus donghaensis]
MADKATIVLFSHVSNTRSITGAEKLLLFFSRELSVYFHCILVAPEDGKLTRLARSSGLQVELMPIPLVYGMYTPYGGLEADIGKLKESREYRALSGWLAALRPAFIITSTCVHALPALAAKQLNIPVIWKISETMTVNEYTPLSAGVIDRNSDEILAISHTVASCFPEDIRQAKVTQLPPSWNEQDLMQDAWSKLRGERRRELRVRPEEPLIGYISSFINKEKGLEHFVKMAVLVSAKHPRAKYVVIGTAGDKSYYDRCIRKVKLEGLHAHFKFVGYEDCLPSAYCAMDLLVVPSLIREGFGMTALEGISFGKPVVAYDSGGLREILHAAGSMQNLVPAEDIPALAARTSALLAEPGLAEAEAASARLRISALYGPGAYRARLQGLAESWSLRYCTPPPVQTTGGLQDPPAAAPAGEDPAPAAPRSSRASRRAALRRGKLRRGRLRHASAKARRRRRTRPVGARRAALRRRRRRRLRSRAAGKRRGARRRAKSRKSG